MKRVLHVLPDLVPYGAERVVATLASLRSRDRFEVSIASLYAEVPGTLAEPLRSEGVPIFHLGKRRGFDPRMFHRLFRVMRDFRPDVIHTHNYVLRYVLPPALLHNPPLMVHTIHNVAHLEVDRLGMWLQSRAFSHGVHPVVIAEAAAESFERVYQTPRPPLIRNGIDIARYSAAVASRNAWRARHGFSSEDLLFLCVARFYVQKNHKTLIDAFASGPAKISHAKLLLAGDGQLRSAIERQANDLGIAHKVHFLGRCDDIPEVLAACDIFALASLWEGNPLSVMEAMAAGLPPVVTHVGGVPELVATEKQGIVVAPGDPQALSSALMRLATNPAMRQAMGTAAAKRAQAEFDDRNMVEAYESLYDELLPAPVEIDAGGYALNKSTAS
jgi:glycosyltransferase involved in cell wall biosynthesis